MKGERLGHGQGHLPVLLTWRFSGRGKQLGYKEEDRKKQELYLVVLDLPPRIGPPLPEIFTTCPVAHFRDGKRKL